MESLFAVVDVYFVSKLGNEAVATVGLTESMLMVVYSVGIGISIAATAVVSRRIGEKKPKAASKAAIQAFYLALFASFAIGIIGFAFPKELLTLMNGSERVVETMWIYPKWMVGGNFVILFLFLFNGVFRGAGDAFLAMIVLTLANGINIILDPILIFGLGPIPAMGLEGAALATLIGRGTAVVVQLVFLVKGVGMLKILSEHLRIDLRAIWSIFKISLGSMGQFLIETASWVFLIRLISGFGDAILAAYVISMRVIVFTILPSWGLANASATLVGQNLGAEQPERAEKSAWMAAKFNVFFLAFVSVLFFILADPIIGFFSEDPVVVKEGVRALKIICSGYIFFAIGMVLGQSFNGSGDTRTPTWIALICFWFIQIPLAYLLAKTLDMGPTGIYWAIAIGHSVDAVILAYLFSKGRWKTTKV
jgi:putative MATE family efflux protein